ncbi:MAG: DUF2378 family protein [Myxococcaceae bacterium]|nr:DUF2378 family protein [Myxococcaceae bacterium]
MPHQRRRRDEARAAAAGLREGKEDGLRLVHAHTVEGLYWKALRGRVSASLKAELKSLGLDLDSKAVDVQQEVWVKMLAATVRDLWPNLSADEGYYRLGELIVQGYETTIMGKALFAMMKLLGPHRVLKRATSSLQNANTYSTAEVKPLGGNRYEVWTNECNGNANYLRAVLFSALSHAGAAGLQVKVLTYDGHAASFDISWS